MARTALSLVCVLACASGARAQEPPSTAPNFRVRIRADAPGYSLYDQLGFTTAGARQPSVAIEHYLCDAPCTTFMTPGVHVLDYERPNVSLRSLTALDVDGPTRLDIQSQHTSHESVRVAGFIVIAASFALAALTIPAGLALDSLSQDDRTGLVLTGIIAGLVGALVGLCLAFVGDDDVARAMLTGEA